MKKTANRILIVEDDACLRAFLTEILQAHGYRICAAGTFNEAIHCAENEPFSLALLDILLDDAGNGIEILKHIRRTRGNGVPVIMQTVLDDDAYCVRCLKNGADDFVVKPVHPGPLIARIEAVLRRVAGTATEASVLQLQEGATVDCISRELIRKSGERIRLTYKETQLLRFLYERREKATSEASLLVNVWNINPALTTEFGGLRSLVSRLRIKLADAAVLKFVYGEGYRLEI